MPAEVVPTRNTGEAAPRLPNATVPKGMVWPPIAGRDLLREIAPQVGGSVPFKLARGAWATTLAGRWRLLSSYWFENLADAQAELLAWAKLHTDAAASHALSPGRCLALNPEQGGGRLWQIVPVHQSLRLELDNVPRSAGVEEWARILVRAARALYEVPGKLAEAGLLLPAGLDRLGWVAEVGRPVFIGFIPLPERLAATGPTVVENIETNLDSVLFELAFSRREILEGVAATLETGNALDPPWAALHSAISRVLKSEGC